MIGERSTPRQTPDQRRASDAWKAVTQFATLDGDLRQYGADAAEYAREAKKLPSRIIAAGLGPSLAFLLAKAKDRKPHIKHLHDHLTRWVIQGVPLAAKHQNSLLESIIQGDSMFLRRATEESLAYLQWLNRFCEAEGLAQGNSSQDQED